MKFYPSFLAVIPILGLSCLLCGAVAEEGKSAPPKGSGLVFFSTQDLDGIQEFYIDRIGCELWLDQDGCRIFRYGNLLLGFCLGRDAEIGGMITFFYPDKDQVLDMYEGLKDIAISRPKENRKYRIFHFFIKDPEGRTLEFQHFLHPLDWTFDRGASAGTAPS